MARRPPAAVRDVMPNMFDLRRAKLTEAYDDSLWAEPFKRYKPGARLEATVDGKTLIVQINEQGWRSDPVQVPKPSGMYRIACCGGSTTVEGWTNETTYPAILQAELRRAFDSTQFEVVNCGVSGFCVKDELERLDDVLALEPDMVVEYGAVNDIIVSMREPGNEDSDAALERRVFLRLKAMAARCREEGVQFAVCTVSRPTIEEMSEDKTIFFDWNLEDYWKCNGCRMEDYCEIVDAYNSKLEKFCAANDLTLIPVAAQLKGGFETFVDVCHMTPEGIARKTRIIASELATRFDLGPASRP